MRATTQTNKETGRGVFCRRYDSWGDFIDHCRKPPRTALRQSGRPLINWTTAQNEGDRKWAGGSLSQAIQWATTGWADGRDQFIAIAEAFKEKILDRIVRQDIVFDVTGEAPCVENFIQGIPEDMIRFEGFDSKRTQTLSVAVEVSVGLNTGISTIRRRGAAIAALIDLLETAGYSVALTIKSSCLAEVGAIDGVYAYSSSIPVKSENQPLDPDLIGFALVSPTVLRQLSFAATEQEDAPIRLAFGFHYCGSFGLPKSIAIDDHDIHFESKELIGATDQQIEEWIVKHLAKHKAIHEEVTPV